MVPVRIPNVFVVLATRHIRAPATEEMPSINPPTAS